MDIDWNALGQVFGTTLLFTIALVGVFTLGILGTARRSGQSAGETSETAVATAGGPSAAVRAGAYACYALCAAAVGYGIYIIVAG
ncbi:hypothetical protein [Streptomyces palmae]|uniref:Uncharacterized protein n=1 Tax=Streptomyces palmae TaxID=1701085 RepID=A0A4Z0FMG2_9ACTN|nr:hypothetical protein [Streptomyces palmae]TGA83415.1 hypothetical protein E4099_32100 [Streptomyces palmae]